MLNSFENVVEADVIFISHSVGHILHPHTGIVQHLLGDGHFRLDHVLAVGLAGLLVNDAGKISEAIVIILYMLRCCLAHGDISPDESANEVYKYAYEVLCAPLKKLK